MTKSTITSPVAAITIFFPTVESQNRRSGVVRVGETATADSVMFAHVALVQSSDARAQRSHRLAHCVGALRERGAFRRCQLHLDDGLEPAAPEFARNTEK
jgi:hypothetical protein